jgi:putative transposase
MKKYKNEKPRKKDWDYSRPGLYFITLVTHGRKCIFGEIRSGEMIFSPLGEIVHEEWLKSFEIRKELHCLAWVIMPNHIHGILKIDKTQTINRVNQNPGIAYRPPRSISSFVAGFKSAATKRINQFRETLGANVWQERFYDHIIRDDASYRKIADYIRNNPTSWENDQFYCR